MHSQANILAHAPRGRFTFVVGKGGTGKSTTAAALALQWADAGRTIHLISTDPAPSIADIFGVMFGPAATLPSPCNPHLMLEELRAQEVTDAWLARVREPLEQLVEQGTYLDATDVARVAHLTLPGIDELGAALRLAEMVAPAHDIATDIHIVVDTAPTGHTLRLLDTATLLDSWADVFRAMSDKVATVALTMVNARMRLPGENVIDEMRAMASSFRSAIDSAQFIVVTRPDDVVAVETKRLIEALRMRRLQVAAIVCVGNGKSVDDEIPMIRVPRMVEPIGCDGLRAWNAAVFGAANGDAHAEVRVRTEDFAQGMSQSSRRTSDAHTTSSFMRNPSLAPATTSFSPDSAEAYFRAWLATQQQRLFWFAGKGGVGKSTCSAAVAAEFARTRRVLLCSTDPAGSLGEVLEITNGVSHEDAPRHLRVLQIDAAAQLESWRSHYRAEAERVFDHLGMGGSATLDRNVMTAIWDAVPPGIDELFALAEILDAAESDDTIVVDAAPTGHFLRLLAAPALALDWTHAILRILLKYGVASTIDGFSERMLAFAKQLKSLQALMTDRARCGAFVVTLEEPVVQAQTARLIEELQESGIAIAALIENRVPVDDDRRAPAKDAAFMDSAFTESTPTAEPATHTAAVTAGTTVRTPLATVIRAPYLQSPPVGLSGLDAFLAQWKLA